MSDETNDNDTPSRSEVLDSLRRDARQADLKGRSRIYRSEEVPLAIRSRIAQENQDFEWHAKLVSAQMPAMQQDNEQDRVFSREVSDGEGGTKEQTLDEFRRERLAQGDIEGSIRGAFEQLDATAREKEQEAAHSGPVADAAWRMSDQAKIAAQQEGDE